MKIDMQGFDLSGFLEAHRSETLDAVVLPTDDDDIELALAHAHDRATTRGLLAVISGQAASAAPTTQAATGGPKAGSKAARDRARKAAATRRRNRGTTHNPGGDGGTGDVDQAGPVAGLLDGAEPGGAA